jgi:hypothetical protein
MQIVYLLLAALGAVIIVAVAVRALGPLMRDPDHGDEPLPLTPLQKRAWLGLGTVTVIGIALLLVVWARGPAGFFEDRTARLATDGLLLGGLGLYLVILRVVRLHGDSMLLDERDHLILGRAARVQVGAILATLLVWAIGLTEAYWETKQIPLAFPYLIFLSGVFVNFLAMPIGILLGYRWARFRGQG